MIQQQNQRAKKWQQPERTVNDLNRICGEALREVKVPVHWKFKEYQQIRLTQDLESDIQCIASIFIDKSTSGFNLKHYRLNFHTYSERLSICQVTFDDYGKPAFESLINNKTPAGINEFLSTIK